MHAPRRRTFVASLLVAFMLVGSFGCQWFTARDELNKGITAYRSQNYTLAVQHFEAATQADPEHIVARQYLATAYATQFIPGIETPENQQVAERAIEEYERVLQMDPGNVASISGIASMYFQMKEMERAKDYYMQQIQLDGENPEPYYSIGVINWTMTYQPRMDLKTALGIAADAPIHLDDEREELAGQSLPLIEEGMEMLNRAMELREEYDDAMAYLNLLYREQADLVATEEEREELLSTADTWIDRAVEIKRIRAERELEEANSGLGG